MSEWCRVKGHDDQHACGDCAYARGLADAAGDVKRLRAALEAIRDGYGVDLDVRGIAARALAASKQP